MSRIGKQPISIPSGVTVQETKGQVHIKGTKGELVLEVPNDIRIKQEGELIIISRSDDERRTRSTHGAFRAEIANAVTGVTIGWSKTLELVGVGYRANLQGTDLVLSVGFSHPVTIVPPPGVSFILAEGKIVISGIDRHKVGQIAANIRAVKPPEPYKGKGIKYVGERIRKKAGKAKAVGSAPGAK